MISDSPCPCCRYHTITNPGCHEQCPVCGWEDRYEYSDLDTVSLAEAQRNFHATGACSSEWLGSVSPPPPALRRAPPPYTIDEWKSGLAAQFVARSLAVFGALPRPRHFTNHHCEECFAHDQTMQAFDNHTLSLKPLENDGWNPLCFLTPEAFRYFMPGLLRVQIEALQADAKACNGWYWLSLIDFHLRDAEGTQFATFAPLEIQLVADFYQAIVSCPGLQVVFGNSCSIDLERGALSWQTRAARYP